VISDLGYLSLHMSQPYPFSGKSSSYEEAEYVVLGVPYDRTSSYRAGSRFAPSAIREASANIETYSMRTGIDVEDLRIFDAGDLNITDTPSEMIKRIQLVVGEIVSDGKIPVMLGGEHSISLGGVKALGVGTTVVDFDAHMDLRNEYNDGPFSHASVMRRISEFVGPDRIVQIGIRAVCKEELEFSRTNLSSRISALDIHRNSMETSLSVLRKMLDGHQSIYLSIDMDVLDPAYAPAVGNPEADGLSPHVLLSLVEEVCRHNVVAIDLTEVAPHYDSGTTSVQAAKVLFESLCCIERQKRQRLGGSSKTVP
jgi:agmatinase